VWLELTEKWPALWSRQPLEVVYSHSHFHTRIRNMAMINAPATKGMDMDVAQVRTVSAVGGWWWWPVWISTRS